MCLSATGSYSAFTFFFFFNDTATTEIYPLSLHDALPIYQRDDEHHRQRAGGDAPAARCMCRVGCVDRCGTIDRKSTRLNSSHANISYAVFCLKKKQPLDLCDLRIYRCALGVQAGTLAHAL